MIQKSIRAYVKLIFILGLLLTFVGEMIYPTTALAEGSSKTEVIIRKYAEGDYSKLLEGAKLSVTNADGSFKEDFDSDATGKKLELPNGTYTLTELTPPPGYKVADPIRFQIENKKVLIEKDGVFVENPYKEVDVPYSVEAYNDFIYEDVLTTKNYAKFYYAKNGDGSKQVVYCFNADLHSPPDSYDNGDSIEPDIVTMSKVKFTQVKGTELLKYAVGPRTNNSEQFLTYIKKVIHKGYKGEKSSIPDGLTATQFRAATQLAIYYFTNSADLNTLKTYNDNKGYHGFEDMNEETVQATRNLIDYAMNEESAEALPDLDFFIPNNNAYQSLIGTQYHPESLVNILRMEDSLAPVVPVTHSLTISKQVVGTIADKQKEFQFELQLKASDGSLINANYQTNVGKVLEVTNGRATFTLKDGQSLAIEGLPTGYSYEITEIGATDYEISVNGKNAPDGKVIKDLVKEDETVTFENRKDLVPPTGLTTDISAYLVLLLVPFGLLFWLYSRKRSTND